MHSRAPLIALTLLAACTRAPMSDVVSPRADDRAAAPATLAPPANALDDGVITARIRAALLLDPAMTGSDVSVNTDHGVVNLTGVVTSREQAAVASGHAQAQDGVMRVDDHLAIALR